MLRGRIVKFDTPNIVAIGAAVGAKRLCFCRTPQLGREAGGSAAIERTIPKVLPDSRPAVQVTAPTEAVSAPAINTGRFTLGVGAYRGRNRVHAGRAQSLFQPYLATEVDEKILAAIAARITDHYRRAGYFLSYATVRHPIR